LFFSSLIDEELPEKRLRAVSLNPAKLYHISEKKQGFTSQFPLLSGRGKAKHFLREERICFAPTDFFKTAGFGFPPFWE
jgi:hypothetical protein